MIGTILFFFKIIRDQYTAPVRFDFRTREYKKVSNAVPIGVECIFTGMHGLAITFAESKLLREAYLSKRKNSQRQVILCDGWYETTLHEIRGGHAYNRFDGLI